MTDAKKSIPSSERILRQACAEVAEVVRQNKNNASLLVLSRYPEMAADSEVAIEVIYSEYVALEELGRRPERDAWLDGFPSYRLRLERLLKFHEFLSESEPAPLAQKSIGNYELLEEIGRGGMGIVYRARQKSLGRIVAIKVIQSLDANGDDHQRFQREAESVASLDHPNIVRVYEIGKCEERPFLAMEYVDGGTLDAHLGRATWSSHEIASLVKALADAMHYAHQRGIVHRDLKPANILLGDNNIPKIVDFGLAKREDDVANFQTQSGALVGTPCYMSPEQASGAGKKAGPTSDVFSLGVILYELLTKRLPFHGPTASATLHQIANRDPVRPSRWDHNVPRDLETICLKCLNKRPSDRYPSAHALAEDLTRFLDHRPIAARRTSVLRQTGRAIARHPQVCLLASALLAICIASVTFFGWQQRQMDRLERQRDHYEARQRERASKAESAYESSLAKARELVGRWTQFGLKLDNEPGMDSVRRRAFEDAVAYYEEFLSKDTNDPAIRLEAAQASLRAAFIHSELGLWSQAETGLRRADDLLEELEPNTKNRWQRSDCLIQWAHVLRRLERWSDSESKYLQAIEMIADLLDQEPSNTAYLIRLANAKINLCVVYGAQQRLDECVTTYLDALRIDLNAIQIRSGELDFSSSHSTAAGDFENLSEQVSWQVALCGRLRERLSSKGAETLRSLARENYLAELALCLDDLGHLLQRRSMLEPAEKCIREAIAFRELTIANASENRRIEQYLARSETHLGMILLATGRDPEAETWLMRSNRLYSKLCDDFPERHDCRHEWGNNLVTLARCYLKENRPQDAIQTSQKAISIHELLVASLPEVESLKQELTNGLLVLAKAFQEARDEDSAAKQYRRALEISPNNPASSNSYSWMILTSQSVRPEDAALAVQLALKATQGAPKIANYRNTLALAYYRMNQLHDASREIDQALELGQGGSTLDWFFKSMILSKLQRSDEARGWFAQAETRRKTESPTSMELRLFSEEAAKALAAMTGPLDALPAVEPLDQANAVSPSFGTVVPN